MADLLLANLLAPEFAYAYGLLGWYLILQERFDEARKPTQKAHELAPKSMAWTVNLGHIYLLAGDGTTAREYYRQTLPLIASEEELVSGPVADFKLFIEQGWQIEDCRRELAWMRQEFEQTYAWHLKADRYGKEAQTLYEQGQYLAAAQQLAQAAEAEKASTTPRLVDLANILTWAGYCYNLVDRYGEALDHYQQALVLARKLGREADIATLLNNIGGVYSSWGSYGEALDHFQQALVLDRKLGREAGIAIDLNNIGAVNGALKNYPAAIDFLEESVEIIENLRTTATGTVRRDYLASQIHTYQWLVSTYVHQGDPTSAFRVIELSRAKLLAEQLAGSESKISLPSVAQIQRALPEKVAILTYANVDWSDKVLMVITSDRLYAMERADRAFVNSVGAQYGTSIQALQQSRQALVRKASAEKPVGEAEQEGAFEPIITYYRHLLTNPSLSSGRGTRLAGRLKEGTGAPALDDLSRRLYEFLVQPLADYLQDKQELLIVPDGILGFLPFETLKDEDGRYLVERFSIRYAQSLSVLDQIQQRSYPTDRKPLLAFGGAVYEQATYAREPVRSPQQLAAVSKRIYADLEQHRSARSAYGALGIGQWTNLPGTLDEVREIAGLVADADTIIGADVAEARVKRLAQDGTLAQYKVLHFATHGLVVPALPELSALVLSQFSEEQEDDGYLRMGEIVELGLQADFVNLSACETGLGKIYGGEGVVGLPQAFLLAGANGLSVSLWSVADRSTAQFMAALYGAVEEEGVGYAAAIVGIKRRFIAGEFGEPYRAPYYWAPFVYYGM